MIVAVCKNGGIGLKNKLPWSIPNELAYLKTTTKDDNCLVMGKNTWDSLKCTPLLGRKIILSSTLKQEDVSQFKNTIVLNNYNSLDNEINMLNKNKIWFVGGKSIYDYYINHDDLKFIHLTKIYEDFNYDVKFPKIPENFRVIEKSSVRSNNNINYTNDILIKYKLRLII